MKTYVVLAAYCDHERQQLGMASNDVASHMTNAETPQEAVAYAISRANFQATTYLVYDHDLNETIVERREVVKEDELEDVSKV